MEQLAEKDQEQEQKREHDTTKELIDEATDKMAAAVELKNMQSVKVPQMMLKSRNENLRLRRCRIEETSQKLETIGAK